MPKFKLEKEKKVKMKKKDLKLKKQSPTKNTGDIKKNKGKIKKGGKVYKYKYEDSDRKIKGKDIASKKSSTKRKQTIKNKNVAKGEVKKTKTKDRVGVTGTTKVKVKGGKNRVLKTEADYRAEAARTSPMNQNDEKIKNRKVIEDRGRGLGGITQDTTTGNFYSQTYPEVQMDSTHTRNPFDRSLVEVNWSRVKPDSKTEKNAATKMTGRAYDMEKAYDKNLPMSERFHYLENERRDKDSAMKMGSPYRKHGSPHHMSNELKYGGPVIDQMKTLSQAGSFKVLKHMKSKI